MKSINTTNPTQILEIEVDDDTFFYMVDEIAFDTVCKYIEAEIRSDDDAKELIVIDAISKGLIPNKPIDHYCYELETFDQIFKKYLTEVPKTKASSIYSSSKFYSFAE